MTDNAQGRLACIGPPGLDSGVRGCRDSSAVWSEANAVSASLWSSAGNISSTRSSDAVTSTAVPNRMTVEIVRMVYPPIRNRGQMTGISSRAPSAGVLGFRSPG